VAARARARRAGLRGDMGFFRNREALERGFAPLEKVDEGAEGERCKFKCRFKCKIWFKFKFK
jgi:hypothetical protein